MFLGLFGRKRILNQGPTFIQYWPLGARTALCEIGNRPFGTLWLRPLPFAYHSEMKSQLTFPTHSLARRSISGCQLTPRESRSGPLLPWLYRSQARNSRSSRNWRLLKTSAYTASG